MAVAKETTSIVDTVVKTADTIHTAAPYLEGLLPLIPTVGVPAAAVIKVIDGALPTLVQAFETLLRAFNGDIGQAQIALISHLTPGMPNASELGQENT